MFWDVSFDDDETVLVLCEKDVAEERGVEAMGRLGRAGYTVKRVVRVEWVPSDEGLGRLRAADPGCRGMG